MDTQTQQLSVKLADCVAACNHCATACLEEDNVKMMASCIRTDLDCAAICSTALGFVNRQSQFTDDLLRQCIEICNACEKECRQHDHDHCQACADACQACAKACENYVGTHV
ncbi:protein of unknown function [Catalinimonas alkaloidigena]|uniref:Four-helix bundle copper-binding protein n=1 Tax=Catalinimonas alkaloidigena TaxID=1075417 RepID=A0A1G9A2L3_9BACT|nr:four-helix bundle copper-binding protein [Catalinimonas alkaloidigena]SDK21602.1 protein of unknown function [Catalinimonas alkaloidigena]